MHTLLSLPRELRDKILFEVVTQPAAAPKTPGDPETRTTKHPDGKRSGWGYGQEVMFHGRWNRTTFIPTLLVNRQLHAETHSAIDRLTLNVYILDIMMVDDKQLWPTWLSVPRLATAVDKVCATFRIFGAAESYEESGFRGGDGGPPAMEWTLFIFLDRFLHYGPAGLWQRKTATSIVSLKELDMNFNFPDHPEDLVSSRDVYLSGFCQKSLFELRRRDGKNYTMHPEVWLEFVSSSIGSLLAMSYHTGSFGAILYERIGKIRVLFNGEIRREWDLAILLSEMKFYDSFGEISRDYRKDYFCEWKIKAYHKRVELGLPVLPFKET